MMKLRTLGCSGGIGGNLRTTSFLLDHDVLIDAGTGVNELSLTEIGMIDHIFVTHSHLDHIACLPFMVDSAWAMRDRPLTVYAIEETLDILKQHVFNWKVWPDFSEIPSGRQPSMRYRPIRLGEAVALGARRITAIPANHAVPAVGYHLDSGNASLVYSGDTTSNDAVWEVVNRIGNLRYLLIETAFSDNEKELAMLSKHLCPSLLAGELKKFRREAEVFITHLKPGEAELTMQQIESAVHDRRPRMLLNNQEFEF
jgi:cAMP phosphodiesterase